jgi:uncharacterized repeat protein (TIGR03803 family)
MNPSSRSAILTYTVVLVLAALAQGQTFATLYNFAGGSDGNGPIGGVIRDSAGNLYGAANAGGDLNCPNNPLGCGAVFEVTTDGTETVLYNFAGPPSDGAFPSTTVTRDKAGNIYGTTYYGGSSGQGTVFKIDTHGNEKVLYSFTGSSDGCLPDQGLVRDSAGSLYGTTYGKLDGQCFSSNYGTIFKLGSAGDFTVLHTFAGPPSDGGSPSGGHLTMDKAGNLYGVTGDGGGTACLYGCGVLYELSKKGKFRMLHSFAGGTSDGCYPVGSVARDIYGNLYGTTNGCGSKGYGTIWKVSAAGKETVLHEFDASDGQYPTGGVVRDSKGNLYGVTGYGGRGFGTLYELSAKGTLMVLHSFEGTDGVLAQGVLRTTKGTLFGTTVKSGAYDGGTVWSYVP